MTDQRCIECSKTRSDHSEDGTCRGQNPKWSGRKRFGPQSLPDGMTCSDCGHLNFCSKFLGNVAENTSCDWFPIRFSLKTQSTVKRAE